MIVLTLIIVALVLEWNMQGKSEEVQKAVEGFRGFLLVALFVAIFLQLLLGIGGF